MKLAWSIIGYGVLGLLCAAIVTAWFLSADEPQSGLSLDGHVWEER